VAQGLPEKFETVMKNKLPFGHRVGPNTAKIIPPVVEIKLSKNPYGRGNPAWGYCYSLSNGVIEIDPRLKSKDYLDTLVHELLHRELCFLREEHVGSVATLIAKELWEKGFRRICSQE
jgi:hypothetical protein